MQTDRRGTAGLTEFVGGEERFLLICTDMDLDAQVHRVFLVCNQPIRTTSSLLQICERTVSEERCEEAVWARAGIPGRITAATFNSPGDHDLRKATGSLFFPNRTRTVYGGYLSVCKIACKLSVGSRGRQRLMPDGQRMKP